jgi:hypothetical protein
MLLKRRFLDGIVEGSISLVFRRWRKPTVKAGRTLNTAIGVLAIEAVDAIRDADITLKDAKRAGYQTLDALNADLAAEGTLYRIKVRLAGADPRIALRRETRINPAELADIQAKLERTRPILELIARHPGRRAADLAARLEQETQVFKTNVRKLKALGLTESLEVGYRLSPRGRAVLARLRK